MNMEEIVNQEIVEHTKARRELHPEVAKRGELYDFLNNFLQKFPNKTQAMKKFSKRNGLYDTKYGDKRHDIGSSRSKLFLSQTPRQFYETIETVFEELGLLSEEADTMKRDEHDKLLLSAYIKLREIGYNHYELA